MPLSCQGHNTTGPARRRVRPRLALRVSGGSQRVSGGRRVGLAGAWASLRDLHMQLLLPCVVGPRATQTRADASGLTWFSASRGTDRPSRPAVAWRGNFQESHNGYLGSALGSPSFPLSGQSLGNPGFHFHIYQHLYG